MMKKLLIVLPVILSVCSCGSPGNPEKAAKIFLTAFNEREFDQAREVSTPETGKLIDLMEQLTALSGNADSAVGGKIIIIDHHIEGETAVVRFREEGEEEPQEVNLKKVEGKWLVHITKQDIANKDMPGGTGEEEGILMEHDSLDTLPSDTSGGVE
jgi:glycine cleavage system H lipoate-binding protein